MNCLCSQKNQTKHNQHPWRAKGCLSQATSMAALAVGLSRPPPSVGCRHAAAAAAFAGGLHGSTLSNTLSYSPTHRHGANIRVAAPAFAASGPSHREISFSLFVVSLSFTSLDQRHHTANCAWHVGRALGCMLLFLIQLRAAGVNPGGRQTDERAAPSAGGFDTRLRPLRLRSASNPIGQRGGSE